MTGDRVELSVHGPAVDIEDAIKVGEGMKALLQSVAESLGAPPDALGWKITSVQFICDGCRLTRPDRPGPDEGWTHRDGDDFCPNCTAGASA